MPLVRVDCSKLGANPEAWKKCVTKRPVSGGKTVHSTNVVDYTVEEALALIIELLASQRTHKRCCPPTRPWVPPPGYAPTYAPTYAPRKGC